MTNKPRAKGTGGETELLRLLNDEGFRFKRMPAGSRYDLEQEGWGQRKVLAVRPDRGQWLIVMDLPTFMGFLDKRDKAEIEVKRRKSSAIHTLYEQEIW